MQYGFLASETGADPDRASARDPAFIFGPDGARPNENEQYKRLIDAQASSKGIPLAHLADRLGLGRPRLHKVIRRNHALADDLRDRLFEALGIDCVRAKFCVVFLGDHAAYDDPGVFLVCEGLKGFYREVISRRRGEIHVTLRPPIIHEALGRAYDMLLKHQERLMESDRMLQA